VILLLRNGQKKEAAIGGTAASNLKKLYCSKKRGCDLGITASIKK
jgi:hypothetical protein